MGRGHKGRAARTERRMQKLDTGVETHAEFNGESVQVLSEA